MNFAIVGVTGNVGRKTLGLLEKSKLKNFQPFFDSFKKKM